MGWTCALLFLPGISGWSQPNTEVYLLNLNGSGREVATGDFQNLSQNKGYDNQPSFYDHHRILFSSTRGGQIDVALYDLGSATLTWKTDTPGGGEYSPLRIPGSTDFSAVRLDTDGKQLLYQYDWDSGRSKAVFGDLKVGYYLWYNSDILVSAVLVEDRMDLVVSNLRDHTHYTFQRNVGRSLHRIPNSELVSFINKEEGRSEVKSVDPVSGATSVIAELPLGVEDVCWLTDGTLLAGKDNTILKFVPESGGWTAFREFPVSNVKNITRMIANASSDILLFTAEAPDTN